MQANQFVVFKEYFEDQQQNSGNPGRRTPAGDYSWENLNQDSICLLEKSKKERVIHGRRASKCDLTSSNSINLRTSKELAVEKSNFDATTTKCPGYGMHQTSARKQSRHHLADTVDLEKVSCLSNMMENQVNLDTKDNIYSPGLSPHETKTVNATTNSLGMQKLSSQEDSKLRRGRRNITWMPDGSHEPTKILEMRASNPPDLPLNFEIIDPKERCAYNPPKLPRREIAKTRIFDEDQIDKHGIPQKSASTLKYPYWTEEPHLFDTKYYDKNAKIGLAPLPPTFQMTRSCYHAGMQGCGAAEAMGYQTRAVK